MVFPKHSPGAPVLLADWKPVIIHLPKAQHLIPAASWIQHLLISLLGDQQRSVVMILIDDDADSDADGDDADGAVPVVVMKRLGFDQANPYKEAALTLVRP